MQDLKVALIQADLHWESIEANLNMFEEKIWKIKNKPHIIVLPEMFTTGFSMKAKELAEPMNSKTFRWMKQQAAQTQAAILGSYIVTEKGQYYNRFIAMLPDGTHHQYDKRHLFALAGEADGFTPGTERLIFEWKGWKICPMICYDLRFPVWARNKWENDTAAFDLLVYMANWPAPRTNAWDTLLQARAIENLSYCIGVNRIGVDGVKAQYLGHSAAYNHKGEELVFNEGKECILEATLNYEEMAAFRNRYPFYKEADEFEVK
ncbi:MAG: amidohydrolase [Imperialibacter sp.]|uniref:amidohydrolase n=1 Tax=Imperialibacter sp. TaxID=2038411 RepID=UPI0032EAEEB6